MSDEALFRNILVFLKEGKFELTGQACLVFNDVFMAVQKKLEPPLLQKPMTDPISKHIKKDKKG